MNIGIRELKAKLSFYVQSAADGKTIIVTDRGKPVAQLAALEEYNSVASGIEQGWIEPAKLRELPNLDTKFESEQSVLNILDEDRS